MGIEEKIEHIYNMLEKMRLENDFVCKDKQCYLCHFGSWIVGNTETKETTFACEYEQREVKVILDNKNNVVKENK